jgi:tetratricopeptide (TPR) repeat protein
MEDFGAALREALAGSPLGNFIQQYVPNPYWPLAFERYSGAADNNTFPCDSNVEIGAEVSTLTSAGGFDIYCNGPRAMEIYMATCKAYEGHSVSDSNRAKKLAREALKICKICPEAYNVLALHASSYEEALAQFKKAVELGTQVFSPEMMAETLKRNDLWQLVPMRAYVRGLFGAGNTLRKMKRYKEALPYYEKLSKLISGPGSSAMSFLNFNAHLPEIWLGGFGAEECVQRALRYCNRACIEYISCQVDWYANLTLALFASERCVSYMPPRTPMPETHGEGYVRQAVEGCASIYLLRNHPLVCELLLGLKPMPGGKIPGKTTGSGSLDAAACYVESCGHLWRETPGALKFLRALWNTHRLGQMMEEVEDVEDARAPQKQLDLQTALEYVNDGIFPNATYVGEKQPFPLLLLAIFQGDAAPIMVEKLLASGARPHSAEQYGLTVLHQACYYGCGRRVVRLLVEAGMDLFKGRHADAASWCPTVMAANQGQWEELDEGLILLKEKQKKPGESLDLDLLEQLCECMVDSGCIECAAGEALCGRCSKSTGNGRNFKHGPSSDFKKAMEVLVNHGLELSPSFAEGLERRKRYAAAHGSASVYRFVTELLAKAKRHSGSAKSTKTHVAKKAKATCANPGCTAGGSTGAGNLKRCSRCKDTRYCGAACTFVNNQLHVMLWRFLFVILRSGRDIVSHGHPPFIMRILSFLICCFAGQKAHWPKHKLVCKEKP